MKARAGRMRFAAAMAAMAVVVLLALFPAGAVAAGYDAQELQTVRLINEYREGLGVDALMVSDLASEAAEKHGSDMGKYAFFSHKTVQSDFFPVGINGGTRMALCGYAPIAWGEVIGAGQMKASTVVEAWKASPDHDPFLVEPMYRVMGVARVYVPDSPYNYYWVVDFGVAVDRTAHWVDDSSATTTTTVPSTTTATTVPVSSTTTTTTSPSSTTTTREMPLAAAFADVNAESPFYDAISHLADLGIVSGSGGLFHPDAFVTRAQFAKIIILALGGHTEVIENATDHTFPDVPYYGAAYPFDFIEEAAALGIIKGRNDGTFGATANVTRAQIALMLVRAGAGRLQEPPDGYRCPLVDVPAFAREAVAVAYYNGLLDGKTATSFSPYSNATRGQVAKMAYGLYQALAP